MRATIAVLALSIASSCFAETYTVRSTSRNTVVIRRQYPMYLGPMPQVFPYRPVWPRGYRKRYNIHAIAAMRQRERYGRIERRNNR